MIRIDPYRQGDLAAIIGFVEAIQEHERARLPALLPGHEIAAGYAATLLRMTGERGGAILVARDGDDTVGFVSAWIEADEDPLLRDEARVHAYVSDVYVAVPWRRQGIATQLLDEVARVMQERGCKRLRVCAKAVNTAAFDCYAATGFRPYEVIFEKPIG